MLQTARLFRTGYHPAPDREVPSPPHALPRRTFEKSQSVQCNLVQRLKKYSLTIFINIGTKNEEFKSKITKDCEHIKNISEHCQLTFLCKTRPRYSRKRAFRSFSKKGVLNGSAMGHVSPADCAARMIFSLLLTNTDIIVKIEMRCGGVF